MPSQLGQVRVHVLAALVRLLVGLAVDIVEALTVPDEVHRLQPPGPLGHGFSALLCELVRPDVRWQECATPSSCMQTWWSAAALRVCVLWVSGTPRRW